MADTTLYDFPGGDTYQNADLAAQTAYNNAVIRLNSQRQNTLQQAGYQADIDPTTGAYTNLRVDPNNPYGGYQQLLRSGAQQSEAAHSSAVGRGLVGGLANQGDREAQYQFGGASNQFGTAFQQTMGGYDQSQTDAAGQRDQTMASNREQAAAAHLQYQMNNTLMALPGQITDAMTKALQGLLPAGGGMGGPTLPAPQTPDTPTAPGTNYGQGAGYAPNVAAAKKVGGKYTAGGGAVAYQSGKGNYGFKPLY